MMHYRMHTSYCLETQSDCTLRAVLGEVLPPISISHLAFLISIRRQPLNDNQLVRQYDSPNPLSRTK